ncbi:MULTISPECIES: ABC transporter substrate-binding protein [Brevibacillus]|uniref:ABC transporter substrate-binding protein n=1 Tax=Brevibacillus TaxID=55080 RepID=UPI000EE48F0E|nr:MULTISPECIES: ABC transporter substrate-binding protein [Brevibacillus]UED68869.1 ABC transporter substrate-binding protein [Brevibacillus sp. HD3.3A]HBZ78797.1 ABC transporter substrate-binding protein [Brevibacillus sp.]
MKRSRIQACLSGIMLFALLLLTACSQTAPSQSEQQTASPAPASEPAKKETRVIKHAKGEATIPVKPERVIALQYLSNMLVLGIKPIGAVQGHMEGADMAPFVKGIEVVGDYDSYNLEKILEMQPDLIVTDTEVEQQVFEKLQKIAPVVAIDFDKTDFIGHTKQVADVLGRQKEGEEWIAKHNAKVEEARKLVQAKIGKNETVAALNVRAKVIKMYGARNMGHVLYNSLQLTPPAPIKAELDKDPNFWSKDISMELLPEYAADHIFLMLFPGEDAASYLKEIESSNLWKNLPAVKNNHVYIVDVDRWLGYDPILIEKQLDEAVEYLTGAKKP